MALLLAAVLACGPEDLPTRMSQAEARDGGAFVRARGGIWAGGGFAFETIRTDSTQVKLEDEVLPSAGVDAGLIFADRFVLFGSADAAWAKDVEVQAVGAALGYRERRAVGAPAGVPDEVTIYAGGLWGSFQVDAAGFGDFDDALGFRAGLLLTWLPGRGMALSAVGEYRLLEFDYEEEVFDGDTHAGGSTVWLGAAFDLRF